MQTTHNLKQGIGLYGNANKSAYVLDEKELFPLLKGDPLKLVDLFT